MECAKTVLLKQQSPCFINEVVIYDLFEVVYYDLFKVIKRFCKTPPIWRCGLLFVVIYYDLNSNRATLAVLIFTFLARS